MEVTFVEGNLDKVIETIKATFTAEEIKKFIDILEAESNRRKKLQDLNTKTN